MFVICPHMLNNDVAWMNIDMVMYVVCMVQENPKNPSLVKIHYMGFMKDSMIVKWMYDNENIT